MQQRGFADIGYNYVIDEVGQVYEGRDLGARGAHTGGHNTGTIGIVLLGSFELTRPTTAQMVSLKALSRYLVDAYAISHLAGHRDFQLPTTHTSRLRLRGYTLADVEPLHNIVSNREVLRYLSGKEPWSRKAVEAWIRRQHRHWDQHHFGWFAVNHRQDSCLIGWCGLHFLEETQ